MSNNEITTNEWVEFRIHSKVDGVELAGYMNVKDAHDEKPLQFYDMGIECGYNVPANHYGEEYDDEWDQMVSAFQSDSEFIQLLVDYADDTNKVLNRDGYILVINCNYCVECGKCILKRDD